MDLISGSLLLLAFLQLSRLDRLLMSLSYGVNLLVVSVFVELVVFVVSSFPLAKGIQLVGDCLA